MVARKSPDWLPTGWKEQVKNINGRKVKSYIDPLTGSKFYSKPQVSEYLKNEKPSTGELIVCKTSLKVEGSYNVNTFEGPSCTSKGKQTGISGKEVVIERVIPDGLPTGWIKETKIQKTSNGNRKDPYYTDPGSGYVFRSFPDALRFLESGNINGCAIKPKKRHQLRFLTEETSVTLPSAATIQHSGHHTAKRQVEGMENSVTNRGLEKRQCTTLSADATMTSTAEHSVNNGIEECAETEGSDVLMGTLSHQQIDPSRSPLPRTEGSNSKQCDMVNVVGFICDRRMQINPSKSEKQEAVSFPRRSSRLMGTKPVMVVNLGLSERGLRAAARNADGNEVKLLVCSAPQLSETFPEEIADHVFPGTEAPLNAKQSNRSNKPLRNKAFSEDRRVRQGTEKKYVGNVESKTLNPLEDTWSDPCLDFAVRTLTGKIQIEEETKESNDTGSSPLPRTDGWNINQCEMVCAENGTVSVPSGDRAQEGHWAENRIGKESSRKMQINSRKSERKEEVSLPRRSSNRLAGVNPVMAVTLPLCEHVPASRKSGESEANVFQRASQLFETVEGSKTPMEDQIVVQEGEPEQQETEKENKENPELQFLYRLEDSWSDPCLEFAVKTLTGEIPIEDDIAIQDYLDDPSHTLRDLGLPNSFQSDSLLDFYATGNPVSGTQCLENPTSLSPEHVELAGCGDDAPQQPRMDVKEEQHQTKGCY